MGTRRKGSPATLACGGYKLYGSGACSNHFIDYDALYRLVLEAVREQLHLTDQAREQLLDTLCAQLAAEEAPREEAAARHRAETEKLERIIEQLYDDRANGLIAQARFYRLLQKYQAQSAALERTAPPPAQPPTHQAQTRAELRRRLALLLEDWETLPALDADLLFALLDRIEVDQGRYLREEGRRVKHQEVTLYFRFQTQAQARVLAR